MLGQTLLGQTFWERRKVLLTSVGVAGCVILLRLTGMLQPLEWGVLDQSFRLRPREPADPRVVIIGIDETDLRHVGKWPIPDEKLAQLLRKINSFQPRAIGLDIYRDLPVEPGHAELLEVYKAIPSLIGIEQLKDERSTGVLPPPELQRENRVGFNNIVSDADGKVRRSLLYWRSDDGKMHQSFALSLALRYLKADNITEEPAKSNPRYLQLGRGVFRMLEPNDGGYVRADTRGYQILANFRGPAGSFRTVSMNDVLSGRVPSELFRDRIVLVGSTAVSLRDYSYTPYSGEITEAPQLTAGVEIQANFVSQILGAALDGRSLLNVWPDPLEWAWIVVWSWIGAMISWRLRSPGWAVLGLLAASGLMGSICYLSFLTSWWLPLIPAAMSLMGSAIAILAYLAHLEEELKRSKEFLNTVINTIPDPIFVKDKSHRWIVLNEAYCKFLGQPLDVLLEKSDYDFFPKHEADMFWLQDNLVFNHEKQLEHEEEFTDSWGVSHWIATKRSVHKDAAGNLFLVGVIRDITERKRMEEELKRTAAELVRSNDELKLSEYRLRHLAHHDVLTGLPNRKLFYERLLQALEWAYTNHQLVGLLFLDLDGFKQINDTHGHDMGDLLLKAIAQRLTGCLRGSDTVSRLGGDEFTIIVPAIPNTQVAARVADKVLSTLSKPFSLGDREVSVTSSIGISVYPQNGEDIDTLIKNADCAMYKAKELGKNRYAFS